MSLSIHEMIPLQKSFVFIKKLLFTNNVFISICGIFFFSSGYLLIHKSLPSPTSASLVFWCTLLVYQINTKVKFNFLDINSYKNPDFRSDIRLLFLFVTGGVIIFHILYMDIPSILFLLHLGIISTLYNVPKKEYGSKLFPLRSIPAIKIFLISYVWSSMASFLPALIAERQFLTGNNAQLFFGHFLFITSITLPFDIRDFKTDDKSELITFPHIIGINGTKLLAIICVLTFSVLFHSILNPVYLLFVVLAVVILIFNASPKKSGHYYLLYLDGTIILYFFAVFLSLK